VVDQQQLLIESTTVGGIAIGGDSEQKLAQVVTAGISGSLAEVRFPVACSKGDLTVEVQEVGGGMPNGVVLESFVIPGTDVPVFHPSPPVLRSLVLPTRVSFLAGERFAIVLSSSGACGVFGGPVGDSYPGGNLYFDSRPNQAGVWVCACDFSSTSWDLPFETVVDAEESSNDPPRFAKGANQTVAEDSGSLTVAGWATSIDDGDPEVVQALKFTATGDNKPLFSVQPAIAADGTLTYTPAANANGMATVSVTLTDDASAGGAAITTAAQSFTITVRPVNDAPRFVKGPDLAVPENSGPRTVAGWATSISAGPADENGQSLTFSTTNDNNALFIVQPALEAGGRLTFTPAADVTGSARVTVTLQDDGGIADGGVDRSAAQTFTITVSEPANEVIARQISYILWMDTSGFLGVWYMDGPQMIA
jgi:hypothetical protein